MGCWNYLLCDLFLFFFSATFYNKAYIPKFPFRPVNGHHRHETSVCTLKEKTAIRVF